MNKSTGARKIMVQGMGQGLTPTLCVDGGMWPPRQTHTETLYKYGLSGALGRLLRCHVAILVAESSRDTSHSPVSPAH